MYIARTHGNAPHRVVVIHGGPGAPGSVRPLAEEIGAYAGAVEPFQTERTLEGQVTELTRTIEREAHAPLILVGHSWGAWLACLAAQRTPSYVGKVILIGSGPFTDEYVPMIQARRFARLDEHEERIFRETVRRLENEASLPANEKDRMLMNLGALAKKTDAYAPIDEETSERIVIEDAGTLYANVWQRAAAMRTSGKLLAVARSLPCEIVVIHGEDDPHPAEGVTEPLAAHPRCTQHILPKCGHTPWEERYARDAFFAVVKKEISNVRASENA